MLGSHAVMHSWASVVLSLLDKIGPGVLVTHSQSGPLGWRTAIANRNIKAVASFEPGRDFSKFLADKKLD